jgi:hypothetical protein
MPSSKLEEYPLSAIRDYLIFSQVFPILRESFYFNQNCLTFSSIASLLFSIITGSLLHTIKQEDMLRINFGVLKENFEALTATQLVNKYPAFYGI